MIDWSKLEPYQNNKYRSFEELCFQIANGLYGQMGRFTPIDDSGGGDGVEFYMTVPTGDEWGWQAKFYYPQKRLSVSGRKPAIKNSLKRACQKHPCLKKWILCTPTRFTPGEQAWFENTVPQSVPQNMNLELVHWSDSHFNNWLSEPRFGGKRGYFFGELELTLDWFRTQVEKQVTAIRDEFNPLLHTKTKVDDRIHALLGDEAFYVRIAERITDLKNQLEEYREAVSDLNRPQPRQIDWGDAKADLTITAQSLQDALAGAVAQLHIACELLSERRLDEVRGLDSTLVWNQVEQAYNAYNEAESAFDTSDLAYNGKDENREWTLREVERMVHRPAWRAAGLMDNLRDVLAELASISHADLHILGDAGVGKTHTACHICHERLGAGLLALLVLGGQFTSDRALTEQLRGILDIPPAYSWNDFLQALAAAAEAYHIRIPLVIDGLDRATHDGVFSSVWQQGLSGLAHEIAQTKDVALITTCRTTYAKAVWPDGVPENTEYAYGFDAYDVETAIEKYFTWYKIKADLTAAPLSQFEHPIYLRIFCESKNPTRQEEKHIYIGEQTLFEVFDEYLRRCNKAVCERLGLRSSVTVVMPPLNKIAEYLWQHRRRTIPLAELTKAVDGQSLETLNWLSSKTHAIEDEGLLVCRDWHGDGEVVHFTYDLLGGYLIAQYLLQQAGDDIEAFVQSDELVAALFSEDFQTLHPMYSDIRRCLATLCPVQLGQYLHDLTDDPTARSLSIEALFEIPPGNVNEDCVDLIAYLFEHPQNRKPLLKLTGSTVGNVHHPLNASFWSERLKALPMPERDISWTEHVREDVDHLEKTLARFEAACQSDESLSDMMKERIRLLAEHIMWVLTSTVRTLRDKATRALYWYGRRFPEQFFDLVLSSLEINDPYVPERMLAAAYGVAMARQYDFKDPSFAEAVLSLYGRKLYEAMFKLNAPYATTHILARDYARRTIDIALMHHPDLLTAEERERIAPPFMDGGVREWGESEDRKRGGYRDGNAPIHMDFENYTLGRLVRDRRNYDFEHEEYKTVRANVYWRIYDLGYSLAKFGDIDKWIVRGDWRYGRAANGGKTDRYGKKYSWIAFYELAGFRKDQGLLREPYQELRIPDADIDPSLPVELQQYNLIRTDFLGNRDVPVEEWILRGGLPNFESYLVVDELLGEQGPWVLLDGYINQEDAGATRSRFIFPRGFIVKAQEIEQGVERLKQQGLGERQLPEIPAGYCTYGGEIPWCDTYPLNGVSELSFIVSTSVTMDLVEKPVLLRDNRPIPADEDEEFWESISDRVAKVGELTVALGDVDPAEVIEAELREWGLEMKMCTVPVERQVHEYETFEVLIPVREYNWKDYHSAIIPGHNVASPAKELAEHLDLCGQPQAFDLFEKTGRRASITFCHGEAWHTFQTLTYLRQDLVERFLVETNSELIWAIWGEREFFSNDMAKCDAFAEEHVYRKVFQDTKVYGKVKEC